MSSRIPKMEVTIDNVRFKEVPDKRQGVKIGSILTLSNVKMSESVADYINNPDDRFYTLVNAVDIDWNAVVIDSNLELHTTSDLIKWIKSIASGGIDPSNYYDKDDIDAKVAELNQADNDINAAIGTDNTPNTVKGRIKSIEDSYVSDNDLSDYTYDKNTIDEKVAQGGTFDPEQYYNKQDTDQLLNAKADSNSLSTVATSGSYDDLTNKPTIPTIPTNVSAFTNDAGYLTQHQDISGKANAADLSAVATTGSYNDLSDKPTIPDALVQADWNESNTSSKSYIKNKPNIPTLATVATSGSYTDLTDKPTIPDAQIQADWNQTTTTAKDYIKNKPTIPTKTSDLVNDSSFITTSDIPEGAAASTTMPKEDGTASTGSELAFARGDHRHPHDSTKADISSLSNVATSGSYNDLNDKPNIPDALIQSDWNLTTTTAKDYIKNKPTLAAVATSGSYADLTNKPTYTKNDVGLGNVLNVEQIPATDKGVAGGVATLDSTGKVPSSQLPSYVDDVIEATSRAAFPEPGEAGKIYVAKDTNITYRWGGSDYVIISETLAIGETSSTAFAGDRGKAVEDKLATIANGAEVNVQADWTESDSTKDSFIQHKPTIPSKTSQLTNDSDFITSADIPEGAAASSTTPLMDGIASVGSETRFARGDHKHPSDTTKANTSDLETLFDNIGYVPQVKKLIFYHGNVALKELDCTAFVKDGMVDSVEVKNATVGGEVVKCIVFTFNADAAKSPIPVPVRDIINAANLATVATTGAYGDLSGTPNLAAVATSGSYSDLSNKPTLATVATSGSYSDLTNKPTSLPANGGNSATVNNHTVNSDVPANAEFTDTKYESKTAAIGGTDVSLVTTGEKYTWNSKQDVLSFNQAPSSSNKVATMADIPSIPVSSVAGKTGAVTLNSSDVGLGNVGNFKAVSTTANQGLTSTEQANARANIGAGTSSFSGSYNDLTNKPSIPAAQVQSDWNATSGMGAILNKPTLGAAAAKGVTDNTTATAVTSTDGNLITARTLYNAGYTKNTGTITGINMNGASKGTSGVVDLGTVITSHQDISGKADKSATVSTVTYDTTNKKITKTINGTTSDVVTTALLKTDMGLTSSDVGLGNVGNFKAVSTVASQGLSSTEQANARANIGAGTSSFSGSYNDLSNKPTIPAAQVQSDWNATTGMGVILNKPSSLPANGGNSTTVNGHTVASNVPANAVFTDTTYSVMGASGSTHASGLVPDTPTTAGTSKYLREDGTWLVPPIVYPETALVEWYMLDNESNNRDNSTDYCMKYAGSKSMLSLVGLNRVYFKQTVTDLSPIFDKNYVISVKFQWYNSNGSWVQTDDYVTMNTHNGWWNIPTGAVGGYVTFNMYLSSHNADIFREVIEEAKIYSNLVGEGRAKYNENAPTKKDADYSKYKQSLYLNSLEITRLGYSKWRIGDDDTLGENSVWEEQFQGLLSDSIIDLGKFPGYNAVVVTGDDTYKCWFTFVTKYPETPGEPVQQSSVYGTAMKHVYVLPKQTLTRLIPSDARYLVVSWRHGSDETLTPTNGYLRPKSIRFISDVNLGALSYAKTFNDKMVLDTYPTLSDEVYRTTGKLNEIKLCSWNIGHYSMGEYAYSTITSNEEDTKKAQWNSFIEGMFDGKKPDLLLFNEFEHQFSPSYITEDIVDYRVQFEWYKDRYCCLAAYSNVFLLLYDIRYFPYSMYLRNDIFSDAMDYFVVYKTYLNDHVIYICSVHLRSSDSDICLDQCNYLINYFLHRTSVLITGDFNREDMSVFTNAGYTVKVTDKTWAGLEAVDHFVYKGYVDIKDAKTKLTDLSDHIPILATLTTTDKLELTGTSGQRPSSATTGFRFFDTTLNAPVYKTEFGFWVDSTGNPVSDWWKTLGTLEDSSTTFDDKSVTVAQSTYSSSWGGWANKKNNTVYRKDYTVNGNPFSAGNIIEIVISGAVKNIEWNLAYLDGNDSPVYYIINEDTSKTYNVYRRIIKIPTVEGTLAKIRMRIGCDMDYFSGKVTINKFVG